LELALVHGKIHFLLIAHLINHHFPERYSDR